jgi:hypothetical protein
MYLIGATLSSKRYPDRFSGVSGNSGVARAMQQLFFLDNGTFGPDHVLRIYQ